MSSRLRTAKPQWLLLAAFGITGVLNGCAFRFQKLADGALGDEGSLGAALSGVPSFESVRKLVLQPKCLNCHTSDAPVLNTYEQVKANLPQIRSVVFAQKSMPPAAPLTGSRAELLSRWIDAGAPREGQTVGAPSDSVPPSLIPEFQRPITYAMVKKAVFEESCEDCHRPGNSEGLSDLTSYEAVQSMLGTVFERAVILGDMPPPNEPGAEPESPPFTRAQRDLLTLWFADGVQP